MKYWITLFLLIPLSVQAAEPQSPSRKMYGDSDLGIIPVVKNPGDQSNVRYEDAIQGVYVNPAKVQSIIQKDNRGNDEVINFLETDDGYVDSRYLQNEMRLPIFQNKPIEVTQPSCGKSPQDASGIRVTALSTTLTKQLPSNHNLQLDLIADSLQDHVGQCPLTPSNRKKLKNWNRKNIYDVEALPLIKNAWEKIPSIPKQSPQKPSVDESATIDDIINIDVLARTIYTEMNGCFAEGVQYPMAVAKVAMNRADLVAKDDAPEHFTRSARDAEPKPILASVLTANKQFSNWNYTSARNPKDRTILMSLCPTKNAGAKENWKKQPASEEDARIWRLSLKIASEAVLFPERFKKSTATVTQLYYTSGREEYDGRQRAKTPQIAGRPVESLRCMYLWEGN